MIDVISIKKSIVQQLDEGKTEINIVPPTIVSKEETAKDVIAHVRYVFGTVGNGAQRDVADIVIKKFEKYVKGNH